MKTHAKTPLENMQHEKNILSNSIKVRLVSPPPSFSSILRLAGKIGVLSVLSATAALALPSTSTYTWDGGGTSNRWSDGNNWSTFSPPSSGSQIHFAGSVDLTPLNDLTLVGTGSANSLTFDANAGAFTLNGNTIGFSQGITNNSSNVQTINMGVQLNNSQTWTASGADLIVKSNVSLNGTTLTLDGTHNFTFQGPITDSSTPSSPNAVSLIKNGSGLATLNGANTFSGSTLVNAGTLVLNGSLTTRLTAVNAGGTFQVNGALTSPTLTVSGGALVVNGSATSTLTTVNSGTFELNGTLTSPTLTVGGGALFVNGSATSTLTTVNGGTLAVNGTLASNSAIVNPNGVLVGNGTINGNVTNGGTVGPGRIDISGLNLLQLFNSGISSINGNANFPAQSLVLTVNGNYTQNPGGTLVIAYGGPADSQHTLLRVQGQANLDGTLRLVQVNGAKLQANDKVPIITATGGVTGDFATVTGAPLLSARVVYEPNDVLLEISQNSITDTIGGVHGISKNLLAVATALDSAAGDPRAAHLFSTLNADSLDQLIKDLQHISPDQLTATSSVGGSVSQVHLQNLELRLEALRAGITGFSTLGFHTADNGGTDTSAYAGPSGPDGKSGKEVAPPPDNNRWGTFITGAGEFNHVGDTQTSRGFNLDSGGITLGLDYRFTPNFVAGIFAGYTGTDVNIADGRINVNSAKLGLYSTYFNGGFYVDTAVQGGYSAYETDRDGLNGRAHGSPHGGDFNLLFSPGYNWTFGALTIGPTASFQYSYQGTNGFTETGSDAPITLGSVHTESLISTFGVKASYDWKVGTTIIRPEVRVSYQHEYGDVTTGINGRLSSGAGDSFTVFGPEIGRDSMLVGAGFSVIWNERVSSYVYYDGEFFRTNYDSSAVTGGFRITF